LQFKLDEIFEEGLEARFARHARNKKMINEWMSNDGLDFFAEKELISKKILRLYMRMKK
jgi:aspartate aminotransferase-like enzyme